MPPFNGFKAEKGRLTPIPPEFFTELLPVIDHLGELKLTLYVFWRLNRMEGKFRWLSRPNLAEDELFMHSLVSDSSADPEKALDQALEQAVLRGTLLKASLSLPDCQETYYFLNSPKGRAAVDAIQQGKWRPTGQDQPPAGLQLERPNIYRLYEENFGPLTPMIAESLRDAETTYPETWISDAIRIAVENNVRRWRYVEAILRSWKEEGRDERKDRQNAEKDRRRYIEGELSDFIEH